MIDGDNGQNRTPPGGKKGDGTRADRLAAALRDNLRRRKLQARGRTQAGRASHDSAEIGPDNSKQ